MLSWDSFFTLSSGLIFLSGVMMFLTYCCNASGFLETIVTTAAIISLLIYVVLVWDGNLKETMQSTSHCCTIGACMTI
uniref:Uncharacterized protein n=1 Tax=Rhizophora mucronata TaxID=61149 RepID=A0A2P2QBZ5_RHIMU